MFQAKYKRLGQAARVNRGTCKEATKLPDKKGETFTCLRACELCIWNYSVEIPRLGLRFPELRTARFRNRNNEDSIWQEERYRLEDYMLISDLMENGDLSNV